MLISKDISIIICADGNHCGYACPYKSMNQFGPYCSALFLYCGFTKETEMTKIYNVRKRTQECLEVFGNGKTD